MTVVPASASCSIPLQASMTSHFIVVGGGFTGLSAAYALSRSGHQVTVLEKDNFDFVSPLMVGFDSTFGESDGEVCRMAPNMSKIFFRWGLEERLRRIAVRSNVTIFSRFALADEREEILGQHIWDEEYLSETGGDFIFAHNSDLRRLAYQLAVEAGATIRANTEAKSIDVYDKTVTLVNGEVLSADAFIGADGLHGISRPVVIDGRPDKPSPTGLVMYNAIIPGDDVRSDPELAKSWESPDLFVACGNGRAALAFPLGGTQADFAIQVYAPDNGSQSPPTLQDFCEAIGNIRPIIRKCVEMATLITRTPVEDRPDLEDWVHDDGPLLVIGGAAHPCPPGSIQASGVSLEDAGVLGKLFSHLSNPDQIQSFLYAFQDLREKRCADIRKQEISVVYLITLPDGEHQQARDAMMQENYANGRSVFHGDAGAMAQQWEINRITFTYDPEDDADAWWLQWGILRERAKQSTADPSTRPGVLV